MKNFNQLLLISAIGLMVAACSSPAPKEQENKPENPAAPGFNAASDSKAIAIADEVMKAMGGRKNYDETRYLFWNFFGGRTLLWDKHTGDVRIEVPSRDYKIILNEKSMEGKLWMSGEEITQPDSLTKYLDRGKRIWINDSYWLVMPFKLKDSGVTLSYVGKDTTQTGEQSEVVRLTFESVGVTPQNAYNVWVSETDNLVKQWAYYANAADTAARFTLPWDNYQQMGNILLSDDRGDRDLSEVQVLTEVPEGIFENFNVTL
ncbi:MAG: hypothetical protein R8G66_31035 [Cytophagales bacterium]|nr:hypothetical protein [Cytophagales bacterium]